ncbi:MAG TPA: hypothetical protein VNF50_00850, partial [Acidimicrobiales bacterium]|nr:hypothetical protein [Acidimicrobiales bacterium]
MTQVLDPTADGPGPSERDDGAGLSNVVVSPHLLGTLPGPEGATPGRVVPGDGTGAASLRTATGPAAGSDTPAVAAGGMRPLAVAFLSGAAAALTTGGIFGSWPARLLGVVAVGVGVAWAGLGVRRPERRTLVQI